MTVRNFIVKNFVFLANENGDQKSTPGVSKNLVLTGWPVSAKTRPGAHPWSTPGPDRDSRYERI